MKREASLPEPSPDAAPETGWKSSRLARHPAFASVASLVVASLVVLGSISLDRFEETRFHRQERESVERELGAARLRLQTVLNQRLTLAQGLSAYVSNAPETTQAEFERFARVLLRETEGVRAVELARN